MISPNFTEKELKATAYHEAGHAFMHLLFGYDVTSVSVNEDNNTGKVESNYSVEPEGLQKLLDKYAFACIAIAGSVSEGRFLKLDEPVEKFGDIESLDDFSKVGRLNLPNPIRSLLIDLTNRILMNEWNAVSAIAEELHIHKKPSQTEVNQFFAETNLGVKHDLYVKDLERLSFVEEGKSSSLE